MRLGQKVVCRPITANEGVLNGVVKGYAVKQKTGRIVYIHPRRRFIIVEFQGPYASYRESFNPLDVEVWGKE